MIPEDDPDLREAFAALRREEQTRAPDFRRLVAEARSRGSRARTAAVALAMALAVLLVLVFLPPRVPRRPAAVPSITEWESPTDFLLATPGREVLTTLPRLGDSLIRPEPRPDERRTSS